MKKLPDGYPLEPFDFYGVKLEEGDSVLVLEVPLTLSNDMDGASKKLVESFLGRILKIEEMDEYGFAWLGVVTVETEEEYCSEKFSFEPKFLQKCDGV